MKTLFMILALLGSAVNGLAAEEDGIHGGRRQANRGYFVGPLDPQEVAELETRLVCQIEYIFKGAAPERILLKDNISAFMSKGPHLSHSLFYEDLRTGFKFRSGGRTYGTNYDEARELCPGDCDASNLGYLRMSENITLPNGHTINTHGNASVHLEISHLDQTLKDGKILKFVRFNCRFRSKIKEDELSQFHN